MNNKLKDKLIMYIPIVLFGILMLLLCFNNNIWTDEAFTMQVMRETKTLGDVWNMIMIDSHPPLYYLMCRYVTYLTGYSLTAIKIFSIVPMLLTMGIGPVVLYKRFGLKITIGYELILATLPCLMEYDVQPRMYTWALFFVTMCGIYGYRAVYAERKALNWTLFGLFGVLSAYTHYFAFASVLWMYGIAFLIIVFRVFTNRNAEKIKFSLKDSGLLGWLIMSIGSLVMYLPWFAAMAQQVKVGNEVWIEDRMDFEIIWGYFEWLTHLSIPGASVVFLLLFILALVLVLGGKFEDLTNTSLREVQTIAILGMIIPALTVLTGIVLSVAIRPVFVMRYVVPAAGLLSIFLSIGLSRCGKWASLVLVIFWMYAGILTYINTWSVEYHSTNTAKTETFIIENVKSEDLIVYNLQIYSFIYGHYFDEDKMTYIEDVNWYDTDCQTMWLLDTEDNPDPDMNILANAGWIIEDMGAFGIEQNDFEIYKIYR